MKKTLLLFISIASLLTGYASAASVSIGYVVNSDWGAAANVTFTLTNNTGTAINNWTLAFDFASVISPYSGAMVLSQTGNHQVLTNLTYGSIPANGTFSFQAEATPGNLGANQPENYLFNGTAVSGGGGPTALQITTTSLLAAGVGVTYSQTLSASGGTPPYTWSLVSNSLPGGLTLSRGGIISGTPNTAGTFNFTVQVSDSGSPMAITNNALSLVVTVVPPALSIANAGLARGAGGTANLIFPVTLSAATTNAVAVNYATADGTAFAGTDYVAVSGTLHFAAGTTQQVVSVTVNGAAAPLPSVQLSVTLFGATNATIANATATGTITNLVVIPTLTVNNPSIFAPATGTNYATFTLTLNLAVSNSVSVKVATADQTAMAGTGYLPVSQTVTFAGGQTQQTVSIGILSSTNTQPAETFALNLSSPDGLSVAGSQGVCTIYFDNGSSQGKSPTGLFNYAEALQKSLFFYECQRAGTQPAGNRVTWRGNSALADGSDAGLDLTGGWYDAGDHVKFGFPMAASTTMLAWAGLEYPDAFSQTGQQSYLLDNLKWVCDYFLKCHVVDTNGNTLMFYGQVGQGELDHAWWGPAEVMPMARPAYAVTRTAPGSDLTGETAAALAACSMLFQASNPTYATNLLANAKALYTFADTYRGISSTSITDAANFYASSGYLDELMWGALWLYRATGDTNYLAKAQTAYANIFVGNWGDQTYPNLEWTQCWDDKTYGSLVLFSELTTNTEYQVNAERWLDWWTVGRPDGRITYTPGGLAWLSEWASLRYAENTAFLALIYSDRVNDHTNSYHNFAVAQVNYALGVNPLNRSFVCGFGNNPPVNPHHSGAHNSYDNNISDPPTNRHTIYGALVGGPDSSDNYTDDRDNYVNNEVACDYNAGFTGALAGLYNAYGGYTLGNFPVAETPTNQFFVLASLNQTNTYFTEIRGLLNNQSAWPARAVTNLHYRYFLNLSELYSAGGTTNNVTISYNMLSGGTISGLQPWDTVNHIYYVELSYDGVTIVPGGSTSYQVEAQFRFTIPSSFPASAWNPANDWSYQNLLYGNQNVTNTGYLVTYMNGVKLEGAEPPPPGSYANWLYACFTTAQIQNPALSSDNADPNHNGYPNLLEYTMGLNPLSADTSMLPRLQMTNILGQAAAVFTYRTDTSATNAALFLDESTNLMTWTPAVTQTLWATNSGTCVIQQVRLHPAEPLKRQLYLRLRAQRTNSVL